MMPRALLNRHPDALDALLALRSNRANLSSSSFEVQTSKPATSDVDACLTFHQVPRRLQDFSRSRRTGSLLDLAIVFLLDLTDTVFIAISRSMYS